MVSEISEYKGHKMIVLKEREDSEYPFSFGLKKAKLRHCDVFLKNCGTDASNLFGSISR